MQIERRFWELQAELSRITQHIRNKAKGLVMGQRGTVTGTVQERDGDKKLKLDDGKWYYMGNTRMDGVGPGARITLDWEEWSPQDNQSFKLKMIQAWGFVPAAAPTPPPPSPETREYARQATTHQGGQPAAQPYAAPPAESYDNVPARNGAALHDQDQLRLISNVLAALVQSGRISSRGDIGPWFHAISCAVRGVKYLESEVPL